jgi:hypothetical protein
VRELVFDATRPERFTEQWQRYDWRLLREGHVFRCATVEDLGTCGAALDKLGYQVHRLDGGDWADERAVHAALAGALDFPEYYGHNLDALNDVLTDVAWFERGADPADTGTALLIEGYGRVVDIDIGLAHGVLDCFARAGRLGLLVGHPMLCLVECTSDLGEVGATGVHAITPP